jgi:hypothetical protein
MTTPQQGSGQSPWARPSSSGGEPVITWVSPATGAPVPPPPSYRGPSRTPSPPPDVIASPAKASPGRRIALTGGVLLSLVLIVILLLGAGGYLGGGKPSVFGPLAHNDPTPSQPPLAQLCPPASGTPQPGRSQAAPPAGARLVDKDSGISYLQLGAPWRLWDQGQWAEGTLGVAFNTGYYFVTERYSAGDYLASVLSGKVPATVGDSLTLNLPCAGRQVAEDVRRAYYPQPTVKEQTRDEQVLVGGRAAWVSTFHLTFQAEGLEARGEQVAVVLVDVGKPDAAVLYISIPDTHKQLDPEIDTIIASIQPA